MLKKHFSLWLLLLSSLWLITHLGYAADGDLDESFVTGDGASAKVRSIALQSDNKVLVGGSFTSINFQYAPAIARLSVDGVIESDFVADVDSTVMAVAVQSDGKILAVGTFTQVNGAEYNSIVRFNSDGSLDTSFDVGAGIELVSGSRGTAHKIAVQSDGKILVGGSFRLYNGVEVGNVIRLETDGSLDTTFNTGTISNGEVNALFQQGGGFVLVGGKFDLNSGGSTQVKYFVQINSTGNAANYTVADIIPNDVVSAFAMQADGKVILGGHFTQLSDNDQSRIGRVNLDGSLDTTFDVGTGLNAAVWCLVLLEDGKVLVAGDFNEFNGQSVKSIIRLNSDGSLDTTFQASVDGYVADIAIDSQGRVIIAGVFNSSSIPLHTGIARLASSTAAAEIDLSTPPLGSSDDDDDSSTPTTSSNPTIEVTETASGTRINSGDTLDFGITTTQTPVQREITLTNTGGTDLELGPPNTLQDYSLLTPFPTLIAANASSNFSLQLDAATPVSAYTTKMSFSTNDPDIGIFELNLRGQVNPAPEIYVQTGTTPIPNGMLSGIDFGSTTETQALEKIFTVTNHGDLALTLTNLKVPHGFSIVDSFATTVTPNASTQFKLRMDAVDSGIYSGLVQFDTNDGDENPFVFRIIGTVVVSGASSIQFASADLSVTESLGIARVIVTRAVNSQGSASVQYNTQDDTAIAGSDYTATSGTLTWNDGEFAHKYIDIPLLTDSDTEPAEAFKIVLSSPSPAGGQVVVGARNTLVVNVIDTAISGSGNLQFSAAQYSVNESQGQAQVVVERQNGSNNTVSIDYVTQDGTAIAGGDYTALSGTLTWVAGDSQPKVLAIPIVNDGVPEDSKSFNMNLSNPQGGAAFGVRNTATITILDSLSTPSTTSGGVLQFAQASYAVLETTSNLSVQVQRANGSAGEVSVGYRAQDGSAVVGTDYVITQGTLSWLEGDTNSKIINITIRNNPTSDISRLFTLTLNEVGGNASIGSPALTTVTIQNVASDGDDTDPTPTLQPGFLQFDAPNVQVSENAGKVSVNVARTDGSDGVVRVQYATQAGTALENKAYVAASGELFWNSGDSSDKTITVKLLDDALAEEDQQFQILLSEPTNGAQLGSNSDIDIDIVDNDATTVRFNGTDQVVNEDTGLLLFSVARQGGSLGEVSVAYRTEDGQAEGDANAGDDYEAKEGTLTWNNGDTSSRTVSLKIIDDIIEENNQRFNVVLYNPSDGVFLGDPSQITITIQDNDPTPCSIQTTSNANIINCTYINEDVLEDVTIGTRGSVIGGSLGGDIQNNGVLEGVTLLPNTQVVGGTLRGEIRTDTSDMGANDSLGRISNATITADSQLRDVIVGMNTTVDQSVTLEPIVQFESNGTIPSNIDLSPLLGYIETNNEMNVQAVDLSGDVWLHGSGLLNTIQALFDVSSKDLVVTQDPSTGYLQMVSADWLYTLLPVQVQQILQQQVRESLSLGIHVRSDSYVQFVTHLGREIAAHPVVQSFPALQTSLQTMGFNTLQAETNGNVKVPATATTYYVARPNLFSITIDEAVSTPQLSNQLSSLLSGTIEVNLTFRDVSNVIRRQILYPAPAFPDALQGLAEGSQTVLEQNGIVRIPVGAGVNRVTYTGVLDYLVTNGESTGQTGFVQVDDVNGDGLTDYQIIYPNGDRQYLFRLP